LVLFPCVSCCSQCDSRFTLGTQGNKTNKGNKAKQQERNANIATGHTQQWTTPNVGSILISILTSITKKVRVFKKHFKNILENSEKLHIIIFNV
jgi:hypothetical protein